MVRSLHSNISKLYIIKLAKWFMLIMPIVALFYSSNNLDSFDIYLLQAVYSVSVAVLEIPSGYMADVVGRKKSLIIGSILGTVGFLIYSFTYDFWGFMAAEIILGLGGSFVSGSDSALLYDSLLAIKKRSKYLKIEGRISSVGNFAETSAALLGGFLAAVLSYRSVYFTQVIIAATAIPAAFLLIEPPRVKALGKASFNQIVEISKVSLFQNKKLSSSILLSSIIGTSTLCMAWTAQVYFVEFGLNEKQITPLWIGLNLLVALSAFWVEGLIKKLGFKNALFSILVFIPLGFLWLSILPFTYAVATLFVFYAVRGYATPVLKDLINNNCESNVRATVLSIRSLIIRLSFSGLGPFIGHMTGHFTIQTALLFAFILIAVSATIVGMFYIFTHKTEN